MRKKSTFEKVTDVMIVGGFIGIAFIAGFKAGTRYMEKRGAIL